MCYESHKLSKMRLNCRVPVFLCLSAPMIAAIRNNRIIALGGRAEQDKRCIKDGSTVGLA